jgi:hypothetical protein
MKSNSHCYLFCYQHGIRRLAAHRICHAPQNSVQPLVLRLWRFGWFDAVAMMGRRAVNDGHRKVIGFADVFSGRFFGCSCLGVVV